MPHTLWILRPAADIELDELSKAIPEALDDPRVELTSDHLADGGGAELTVATLPIALELRAALTEDDFGGPPLDEGARAELDADPRQHRHAALSATPSARANLRYLGILLAEHLGASVYDPEADDPWLSVGNHTLAELRERLDG